VHAQLAWAGLNLGTLEQKISAAKNFKGRLGVGVIDVQTGKSWYLNGDDRFPMESVVKVPVVIAALRQVDKGKLHLEDEIKLSKSDVSMIRNSAIPDSISPLCLD